MDTYCRKCVVLPILVLAQTNRDILQMQHLILPKNWGGKKK